MILQGCMFALLAVGSPAGHRQTGSEFALKDGDRVVFYGDSITDNSPYCEDVETYTLTRFPHLNVRFFNAGVGGDRVGGGWMGPIDQRLTRDLISRKPTVVTSMLGMNDAGYSPFHQDWMDNYKKGYQHILDRIHSEAPGARVWLFRPSPFDDVNQEPGWADGGYDGVLSKYADTVSDLATANHAGVVDQHGPLVEDLRKAKAANPNLAKNIIGDRIHPGWQGDYWMAQQVITAWGGPSLVAAVTVDASTGAVDSKNAKVTQFNNKAGVSWSETDGSLPFPVARKDELASLVLASSAFDDAINQEPLIVKGLQAGNYQLKIDGKEVGSFSADQFAAGVNLALLDTPMTQQADKVRDLTSKRCGLWYARWRRLDFEMQDHPSGALEDAKRSMDRLIEEVVKEQHATAQPKTHRYEIVSS